jgi:hypothetical protein
MKTSSLIMSVSTLNKPTLHIIEAKILKGKCTQTGKLQCLSLGSTIGRKEWTFYFNLFFASVCDVCVCVCVSGQMCLFYTFIISCNKLLSISKR